jgi:hypothetical protein
MSKDALASTDAIASKDALAIAELSNQSLQKTKPRYTEAENRILFESWWDPQQRRELVSKLGRKMSALRSQFCRLLKERNLTNQEYYNIMHSKYTDGTGMVPRKRSRELKDIDRTIMETFCRNQALGNSRSQACEELQQKLGSLYTPAALKLRFYRLIKRFHYNEADLLKIGKELLNDVTDTKSFNTGATATIVSHHTATNYSTLPGATNAENPPSDKLNNSIFYQISALPDTVKNMEERLFEIEQNQRHQLDLRGFIEHLLAVERDIKKEDKLMEEIQRLMDENEHLKNMLAKELERLKKREEELSNVYRMLDTMLSDFMRLESVSKLASLGDFMHRLEITVDQFGNVLQSRRLAT